MFCGGLFCFVFLFIDIFADVNLQVQHSEVDQMFTGNVSL